MEARPSGACPVYAAVVHGTDVSSGEPVDVRRIVASALAGFSAIAFLAFFLVLRLPVWLTGSEASLLLWPLVFLVGVVPWLSAVTALILVVTSLDERDSRASVVVCVTSVALVLAPGALWFGVP